MIPFFVPKTVKVTTELPYTLVCEYETGEVKSFDVSRLFNKHPELLPLKDNPELFATAAVDLTDYLIEWNKDDCHTFLHGDYVYAYGKTLREI